MNTPDDDRLRRLLKQALPPLAQTDLGRDLWPAMLRRLEVQPSAPPWFDWVLAGGLAAFAVAFPAWIPVFLYYL